MKLIIPYTQKRLRRTLFFALFYWVLVVFGFFSSRSTDFLNYLFVGLAIFAIYVYFRERKLQYLTIEDNSLKRNDLWGSSISLNEVTEIEKYAGDYILKSPKKKLRIDTHIIPPEALRELDSILYSQTQVISL